MKNSPKNTDFYKAIKDDPIKWNFILVKMMMQCCGLWPEQNRPILTAIGYINVLSFALLISTQVNILMGNFEPLPIQTICYVITLLQVLVKLSTPIMYKKELAEILRSIWFEFLPVRAASTAIRPKIRKLAAFNRRIIYCFMIGSYLATFLFYGMEIFKGNRKLIFSVLFIPQTSPAYELIYLCEWFVCAFATSAGIGFDLLFGTLVFTCVAQFKIINSNLKLLGSKYNGNKIKFVAYFSGRKQKINLDETLINKYVTQHNILIGTCLKIADVFQYIALIQVLTSVISLCFCAVATRIYPEQMLENSIVSLAVFSQLTLYCWFSEQLTSHAGRGAAAGFESAWYHTQGKWLQKSLISIIQESNREIAVTAGGFTKMSLNTLVQVLKFCVSFYALMDTIMNKKEP